MKKLYLIFIGLLVMNSTMGQPSVLELTFKAVDNTMHVQLDSIRIMNRTQGGDTVLIWPDTVLLVNVYLGIAKLEHLSEFQFFKNYPNPVGDQATINLIVPDHGQVNLMVTDVLGRTIYSNDIALSEGTHALLFTPGKESAYFLSAFWRGERQTIKILHYGFGHRKCLVEYVGLKSSLLEQKSSARIEDFIINPGDELLFIGYAAGLESGILDAPFVDSTYTYTFQFATNIPCLETPTVEYEGQVYNTIQIFSQCWLKENLNVGTLIDGTIEQSNNGTIEKYCYNNEPDSCIKYGGLYQWNEIMQYTTQQGIQGICPPGWHLPMDEEWKVMEGELDSQYSIGDTEWDGWGFRGYNAGTNMKTTSGWYDNGTGSDLFGFSGLPGGDRVGNDYFDLVGRHGTWWTSTECDDNAWGRDLYYDYQEVGRYDYHKGHGFSVRCLRD